MSRPVFSDLKTLPGQKFVEVLQKNPQAYSFYRNRFKVAVATWCVFVVTSVALGVHVYVTPRPIFEAAHTILGTVAILCVVTLIAVKFPPGTRKARKAAQQERSVVLELIVQDLQTQHQVSGFTPASVPRFVGETLKVPVTRNGDRVTLEVKFLSENTPLSAKVLT